MSHPSISADVVAENLDDLKTGKVPDLANLASQVGDGPGVDLTGLADAVADIKRAFDDYVANNSGLDDDQFEGSCAAKLHRAIKDLSIEVLDDPGFWAYVATGPLWFLTKWREDPTIRNPEGYHLYVDGTKADACVPLRMFLRAQAIELDGDYSLASAIPAGVDFWRSHVLRVRTGGKKDLARAVAIEQRDRRMTVDPVREYAKRVNRRWSNQVIQVLDASDCQEIATTERP
jgi:hypothetical protein